MNIKKAYEEIIKIHKKLAFKIEEEDDDCLIFTTDVIFERYKGSVLIKCTCYEEGTMHIMFTLDQIDETYEILKAINKFNKNEPFLKMYLINHNHKKFLELHYFSKFYDEDSMVDEFEYAFDRFADDREVSKQIKILANNTYTEEEAEEKVNHQQMN